VATGGQSGDVENGSDSRKPLPSVATRFRSPLSSPRCPAGSSEPVLLKVRRGELGTWRLVAAVAATSSDKHRSGEMAGFDQSLACATFLKPAVGD
jgi:hypothetical protein